MTLEIQSNNRWRFRLYWRAISAYNAIVDGADLTRNENPENAWFSDQEITDARDTIMRVNRGLNINNPQLAQSILNDWVQSSSNRYVRAFPLRGATTRRRLLGTSSLGLVALAITGWWSAGALAVASGTIYVLDQYMMPAQRRVYPNNALAAIALAAEINSEKNFARESQLAEAIFVDGTTQNRLQSAARRIAAYYTDWNALRRLCNDTGEYGFYINGLRAMIPRRFRNNTNLLDLIAHINVNEDNCGYVVAILHDISVFAKKLASRTVNPDTFNNAYTLFDEAAFRMTIKDDRDGHPNTSVMTPAEINQNFNVTRWTFSGDHTTEDNNAPRVFPDYRTPNERHPALKYARSRNCTVQMGPTRTTLHFLQLARSANCNAAELRALTMMIFAFWNAIYDRACTMVHCFHFTSDCLFRNFMADNDDTDFNAWLADIDRIAHAAGFGFYDAGGINPVPNGRVAGGYPLPVSTQNI